MRGCYRLSEFFPILELLPPLGNKTLNSPSKRKKIVSEEEDWRTEE